METSQNTKIKIQIKNRWTGSIIFEYEKENNTVAETVKEYIRQEIEDRDKYLANLTGADLTRADLTGANLTRADLTRADLTGANLTGADLTSIKNDLFIVLLHSIREIPFLKKNVIEGKIDGSTYDGECACLSGTLEHGAIHNNGPEQGARVKCILSVRNASRPIEKFFTMISPGHTPENNLAAKLVMEWIEEFERLIAK